MQREFSDDSDVLVTQTTKVGDLDGTGRTTCLREHSNDVSDLLLGSHVLICTPQEDLLPNVFTHDCCVLRVLTHC